VNLIASMYLKEEVLNLLQIYNNVFPDENEGVASFAAYLERNDGSALYTRKNFDGHITTSAFIVDADKAEILLLKHKSLKRWLQPGGHTEGDVSFMASALREAIEETGMTESDLSPYFIKEGSDVPFDIDSHHIPANPKKGEDAHFHHDLRYLFLYNGDRNHIYNEEEATGMQWVNFSSLKTDETFGAVIAKIEAHLATR
jgi:8-oxo-dGTP pyrophosphatase MutT (NUDIX family)